MDLGWVVLLSLQTCNASPAVKLFWFQQGYLGGEIGPFPFLKASLKTAIAETKIRAQ